MRLLVFILILFFALPAAANLLPDSDNDGVPDIDEIEIYKTDPNDPDTDNDGYSDWLELNLGYSPHTVEPVKLSVNDMDKDGLSDELELKFGTNILAADSDDDGFKDGEEIDNGYDPLNKEKVRLEKRLEINLAKQELSYFLDGVRMGTFLVSSGVNNSTPRGHYAVNNKHPKAWSPYGLWMPYWMGLNDGRIGIHELPVWPNGYVEGEDHLGRPVSHGCIRMGKEPAEFLYNWTPVNTGVFIY